MKASITKKPNKDQEKRDLALKYLIQEVEKHENRYKTYNECEDILHPLIMVFNNLCDEYKGAHSSFYCSYEKELRDWFRKNRPNVEYRPCLEYDCAQLAATIGYEQLADNDYPMLGYILGIDEEDDKYLDIPTMIPSDKNELLRFLMKLCLNKYASMTDEEFLQEAEDLKMEIYILV